MAKDKATEGSIPLDIEGYADVMKGRYDPALLSDIPRFRIIQSNDRRLSDQQGPLYGAEAGAIFNVKTLETTKLLYVLLCYVQRSYLEWFGSDPFESQLVGRHMLLPPEAHWVPDKGHCLKNGNRIMKCKSHYILIQLNDGGFQPGIIDFSRTALKESIGWVQSASGKIHKAADGTFFHLPLFAQYYSLHSIRRSAKTYTWFGWEIVPSGKYLAANDPAFKLAFQFHLSAAKATEQTVKQIEGTSIESQLTDDIPF